MERSRTRWTHIFEYKGGGGSTPFAVRVYYNHLTNKWTSNTVYPIQNWLSKISSMVIISFNLLYSKIAVILKVLHVLKLGSCDFFLQLWQTSLFFWSNITVLHLRKFNTSCLQRKHVSFRFLGKYFPFVILSMILHENTQSQSFAYIYLPFLIYKESVFYVGQLDVW